VITRDHFDGAMQRHVAVVKGTEHLHGSERAERIFGVLGVEEDGIASAVRTYGELARGGVHVTTFIDGVLIGVLAARGERADAEVPGAA
jgi:hypothetical protein